MRKNLQSGFAGLLLSGLLAFGFGLSAYNDMTKSNTVAYHAPSLVHVEAAKQLNQSGLRHSKQLIADSSRLDALIEQYRSNRSVVIGCGPNNRPPEQLEPTTAIRTLGTPASNQEIVILGVFAPHDCSKSVSSNNYRLAFKITGGVNCNLSGADGNSGCVARSSALSAAQAPAAAGCVWALTTTGNAFLFNSGNTIEGGDCEFHSNSASNSSGDYTGHSVVWNQGNRIELGLLVTKGSVLDNAPKPDWMEDFAGVRVQGDPFERGLPQPVGRPCTYNNFLASGSVTLNPGVYCGSTNLNVNGGTVRMNAGLYVLRNGDFNVNQGVVNATSGVTIFHETNNRFALNGNSSLKIKAPQSGTYAGLALYEKYNLSGAMIYPVDANGGIQIEGLVYLPSKHLIFNSGSSVQSNSLKVVGLSVNFSGTNWMLSPFSGSISGGGGGGGGSGDEAGTSEPVVGK